MTFVDENQVKKVGTVFSVEPGSTLVSPNRLVDRDIYFPTPGCDSILDSPSRVPAGGEVFFLRVVNEYVAVSEVEDPWAPSWIAGLVPPRIPKFPTNLKRNVGFAGTGRHR